MQELSDLDKLLMMWGITAEQLCNMILDYTRGKEVITVNPDGTKHVNIPQY